MIPRLLYFCLIMYIMNFDLMSVSVCGAMEGGMWTTERRKLAPSFTNSKSIVPKWLLSQRRYRNAYFNCFLYSAKEGHFSSVHLKHDDEAILHTCIFWKDKKIYHVLFLPGKTVMLIHAWWLASLVQKSYSVLLFDGILTFLLSPKESKTLPPSSVSSAGNIIWGD